MEKPIQAKKRMLRLAAIAFLLAPGLTPLEASAEKLATVIRKYNQAFEVNDIGARRKHALIVARKYAPKVNLDTDDQVEATQRDLIANLLVKDFNIELYESIETQAMDKAKQIHMKMVVKQLRRLRGASRDVLQAFELTLNAAKEKSGGFLAPIRKPVETAKAEIVSGLKEDIQLLQTEATLGVMLNAHAESGEVIRSPASSSANQSSGSKLRDIRSKSKKVQGNKKSGDAR